MNPLHPLTYGTVLIAGGKTTNFPTEIVQHPRVIMWQSQDKHWESKELPSNVRAILVTKWLGHSEWVHLQREARKKRVTLFTPTGTGLITKNVKELLGMNKTEVMMVTSPNHNHVDIIPVTEKMTETPTTEVKTRTKGKLNPLIPFIDENLSGYKNAPILLKKAEELGITTTRESLANFVDNQRKKGHPYAGPQKVKAVVVRPTPTTTEDVSIQLLDKLIVDLKDIRQYLLDTTKENRTLRTRIEKFKNFLETE